VGLPTIYLENPRPARI